MELFCTNQLKYLTINYPDITFSQGKFTFITGESGCGKSSLLKLLNMTALPVSGSVYFLGSALCDLDPITHRKKVLLASQEFFLFDNSIKENFRLYYEARDEQAPSDDIISEALHTCCIDFDINTICSTMSGGERQRVFLAICLSFKPSVILLDEPSSALDEKVAANLFSNIVSFCKQNSITPIAVCHTTEIVSKFADKVIKL